MMQTVSELGDAERIHLLLDFGWALAGVRGRWRQDLVALPHQPQDPATPRSRPPDLARAHSHELRSGWWIGTNVSRKQISQIIGIACIAASLRFITDVIMNLG